MSITLAIFKNPSKVDYKYSVESRTLICNVDRFLL